jgi:hypothetical protein
MGNIEHIAYQFSKITNNVRYEFSEELYTDLKKSQVGRLERRIEDFFIDASKFLSIFEDTNIDQKMFTLNFESEELLWKAMPVLKSHDLLWNDDSDELMYEINQEKNEYKLFVSVYSESAYNFVFGNKSKGISISKLSKLLNTKIDFTYYYEESLSTVYFNEQFGSVSKGKVSFAPIVYYNEINEIGDISHFNQRLYELIDIIPNNEVFNNFKPKISLEKVG